MARFRPPSPVDATPRPVDPTTVRELAGEVLGAAHFLLAPGLSLRAVGVSC